jgi:hypothetical protein
MAIYTRDIETDRVVRKLALMPGGGDGGYLHFGAE